MSWRGKLLLIAAVSAIHFWIVFYIFSSLLMSPLSGDIHHKTVFHATLSSSFRDFKQSETVQIASLVVSKNFKIKPEFVIPLPEQTSSAQIETLVSNPTPRFNYEEFLEASSPDETSIPMEGFEEVLSLIFPPNFESLVIEFWIDNKGNTTMAQCMEGNCGALLPESLNRLLELHFYPAIKDGLPVSSRKLIQIDLQSAFGS
jgi:hypothetical protein